MFYLIWTTNFEVDCTYYKENKDVYLNIDWYDYAGLNYNKWRKKSQHDPSIPSAI